jgi:energy-coupling factor transporter ATP-binding protein EcfA2
MHDLMRISFHNWYAFEALDLDVGGTMALVGPTGAGKSAVLDAIQTVLTGANHNFLALNASAGQQRNRTIVGYCLGCISDVDKGLPRRERAETILALVFRDQDSGVCFSAGLLLRADKNESKETVVSRFLARGHAFRIADYIERDREGDEFVVSQEEIIRRLASRLGRTVTFHNATAQGFVEEMLTAMRPKSSPEPVAFLRSFSNALLAKEIKDPTDFVRRFVLPPRPLNVGRIRTSIGRWKTLEARTIEIEQEIREIGVVRGRFATWARQTITAQSDRFVEAHAERLRLERETAALEHKAAEIDRSIEELAGAAASFVRQIEAAEEDARIKNRLIDQSGAGVSLRAIEIEESAAFDRRREGMTRLETVVRQAAKAAQLAPLREIFPIRLHSALDAAKALARTIAETAPESWVARADELAGAARTVASLAEAAPSLRQQRDARIGDLRTLEARIAELRDQLSGADAGGPLLSRHVAQFQAELKAAGILARPLPDLVEIRDESWAPALEMVLGPNREALLVADADRDRAFDLLWRRRNEFHGCRLVNTRRTRSGRLTTAEDSLARVVETDEADIRAFIDREAGRVIRAEVEADLELHERAITREGKSTAGAALRVYRDMKPILGRTAQAAAGQRLRSELMSLLDDRTKLDQDCRMLDVALAQVETLGREDGAAVIREVAERIKLAALRLQTLERDRGAVEDTRTKALREEVEQLKSDIEAYKEELRDIGEKDKAAKVTRELTRKAIEEKREAAASRAKREEELEASEQGQRYQELIRYAEAADETIAKRRLRLQVELELHQQGREMEFLAETRSRARRSAEAAETNATENARRALRDFGEFVKERLGGRHPLPMDAEEAAHFVWCVEKQKRLEEHELRPHREKVAEARSEVEHALKDDLLSKLSERFDMVRTQIDTLNHRLSNYSFVGHTYSFSRWTAANIKPLYELSKRVGADLETGLAGVKPEAADAETRQALALIEQVVTTEDDVRWLEDYRNYFEFELHLHAGRDDNEPQALSKIIGLLSGGQRQAPYYVAIAASMVSIYFPRVRDRGTEGIGLVALDEAFNKLDIINTQKLIGLYRDLGLQLLVAAPESARPTFLEVVDCIISVSRVPYTAIVYIDAERVGPHAKAAMAAENPEHRGIEGFRAALTVREMAATGATDERSVMEAAD